MEEIFSLEKSIIDEHGKVINLKITEADGAGNAIYYRCVVNGEIEMYLTIDDDGNWVDTKQGSTQLAEAIGNVIEDNFE